MYRFKDYYHNEVQLSFEDHPYSQNPRHVWVICRYGNKWLLTEHEDRGLEFPGGKVENEENAQEAAVREVKEETGGTVEKIDYLGQYKVFGKEKTIIKNIYFATVSTLTVQETYFETKGPVLLQELPKNIRIHKDYSFIMKDDVLEKALEKVLNQYIKQNSGLS
ncbi:nucleoside triphosphatase YtkD [Bacillus lacus]|uniref:Nucleoside triphosphatase YtkD n=1 Tax=Metabacillus lacus TaxID=1983721 RepID=A0A7X2IZ00_9BACI|nr:nucleoside triphosphatase YtkD [Metabacillus lacus]MRX72393.1 nucleoside triphosphatase YtkD [Metabacillus lacus]